MKRILLVATLSLGPFLLASPPAEAGGGGCLEVTSGQGAAVGLKGSCIFPTLLRVPSGGGAVTFTNYDAINHVVVGAGYAWGSDGIMHQGDSFTAQFDSDGVYPFQCYLHPGMSGAVLVGDANARGAATSGIVAAPVPSNVAPTLSPGGEANPQTLSEKPGWWLLRVGGLVLAAAVATIAMLGPRFRSSKVTESPTADA